MQEGNDKKAESSRVVDPLGTPVHLTGECWQQHILRRHPELKPYRTAVEDAIEAADQVLENTQNSEHRRYIKEQPVKAKKYSHMDIVVHANVRRSAYVATAHFAKGAKLARDTAQWRIIFP